MRLWLHKTYATKKNGWFKVHSGPSSIANFKCTTEFHSKGQNIFMKSWVKKQYNFAFRAFDWSLAKKVALQSPERVARCITLTHFINWPSDQKPSDPYQREYIQTNVGSYFCLTNWCFNMCSCHGVGSFWIESHFTYTLSGMIPCSPFCFHAFNYV